MLSYAAVHHLAKLRWLHAPATSLYGPELLRFRPVFYFRPMSENTPGNDKWSQGTTLGAGTRAGTLRIVSVLWVGTPESIDISGEEFAEILNRA